MGAAGLSRHSFNAAPANVMKVILLPDRATNTARWLARQDATPGYTDLQAHDAVYDETKNLLATNGERFVAVKDPATDNCVDASLIRLCNGVLKRLVTPPKADARTAQAELCFYVHPSLTPVGAVPVLPQQVQCALGTLAGSGHHSVISKRNLVGHIEAVLNNVCCLKSQFIEVKFT